MANAFARFNPWDSVLKGQQSQAYLDEAAQRGRAEAEDEALRKASAEMGQGDYLTGFEGVPGAQRPNYLRELFARNPKAALELEGRLAAPYALERDIRKAGEIERAKKEADADVYNKMIDRFMGSERGKKAMEMGTATTPSKAPAGPGAVAAPETPLEDMPGAETSFEITPQGPRFGVKQMSPFEKAVKARGQQTVDAAEARQTLQAAHENVRKAQENIFNVQKGMQAREIPWEEGVAQIGVLKDQLSQAIRVRDQLLRGGPKPAAAAAPPAAVAPGTPGPIAGKTPATAPKFTEKEQANLDIQERTEKTTAANKEIANARLGAEKITKYKRQVKELFDLVTKQDIGHPSMEEVPGAATVLTMNRANAQVKKLAESIINMFSEPGQSQMMNTIVERQMQGAVVPNIFTDPQLNKINAAVLRSNVEHLGNFPTFLEKWQKTHHNTLDGAAEAWIDYTDNNPLYTYSKDARGRVTVSENSHVLPLDKWMQLRQSGGIRKVGDRLFIKQDDGSWVEK